jgi:hypothetical protein
MPSADSCAGWACGLIAPPKPTTSIQHPEGFRTGWISRSDRYVRAGLVDPGHPVIALHALNKMLAKL